MLNGLSIICAGSCIGSEVNNDWHFLGETPSCDNLPEAARKGLQALNDVEASSLLGSHSAFPSLFAYNSRGTLKIHCLKVVTEPGGCLSVSQYKYALFLLPRSSTTFNTPLAITQGVLVV